MTARLTFILFVSLALFSSGTIARYTDIEHTRIHSTSYAIPLGEIVLNGYLTQPAGSPGNSTRSDTMVIILHGWFEEGINGAKEYLSYAEKLVAMTGYSAVTLSMRGWPDTGGLDDCGHMQALDMTEAIDWLTNQESLKIKSIGLIGFSQGGQVSLLTAANSKTVDFVVAYYPVTDIEAWQRTSNISGITDDYIPNICDAYPGIRLKSPIHHANSIQAPVLFIHGSEDLRVPVDQSSAMARKMQQADRTSELFVIGAAGHGGFSVQQESIAFRKVMSFIDSYRK